MKAFICSRCVFAHNGVDRMAFNAVIWSSVKAMTLFLFVMSVCFAANLKFINMSSLNYVQWNILMIQMLEDGLLQWDD